MASDLVNDSKLLVRFSAEYTYQMFFESDSQPGQQVRRLRKEEVWRKVKYLGEGGFGSVWLEQCPTTGSQPKSRAVKAIPKVSTLSLTIDYKRELEAIAKFSQAKYDGFFVRSFGWYEDAKLAYITMEYFELGDLQKHLWRPIPEQETQQVVHQLLEGLEQLHMNGFAHRDLKPANIFVVKKGPDWWVKIGDFGISKRVHDGTTSLRTLIGTPGFIAPEVLENDGSDLSYTCKVDMWSLGVITHYMITATLPFDEQPKLRRYTKDGHFPSAALVCSDVSQECHDFIINGLMATAAATRLSASDALQHRWLNHLCKTQGMVSTSKTAIASLESTEASAKWSALNGTEYQPSGRTALQMHTEQKGEAYLSLGPASMQAMHGQGKTIEQINIEITSIIQNGRSLYRQDRYKEAESMIQRALQGQERLLGSDHIDTLNSIHCLGLCLYRQKRYKEAESMFRQALQGQEKVLGSNHTDTLDSAHWLGLCLYLQKRYKEAENMFRRALQGREKVLGSDNIGTLDSAAWLGLCLYLEKRYKEAESMFRQALQGQEKVLGSGHRQTTVSRYWANKTHRRSHVPYF